MINTLAQIDWIASSGRSPWHRASALAKLLVAALAVALALAAPRLALQVALYAAAWALALSSRLPLRLLLAAGSSPLLFSVLFVLLRWDGSWQAPLKLVLRPMTATMIAVWLVGTTPYPDLFAPISRVLPRAVADGLFITYRALFELLARAGRLFRSFHLRGGDRAPVQRRLPLAGEGLGTLVLYGFERGNRIHSIMLLRGHSGRVCGCRHWAEWTPADGFAAAAAAVLGALAFTLWRR